MKIYNYVVIFGNTVNINYSELVPDTDNANYDTEKEEILIHPRRPKKELARVFMHEFLHSVFQYS